MMLKLRPFFYSSPPNSAKQAENKKIAKASVSSESEPDSLSIESSSEEAQPKNHMGTENHKQIPPLEYFPQSPLELTETDNVKKKPKTGIKKIIAWFFDKGGKRNEKKPEEENCQPITVLPVDQIKKLIQSQHFCEASEHLIMQKKSNSNLDSRNGEETLDNQTEIEDLLELLYQKIFNTIESSISIALTKPELLKNAVSAVVMWVEEEENSQLRMWKEEWRNTIQKSVEERMNAPPLVSKDLSTIGNTFLHMGKTMKDDMITVVQHIKHHYPEHFQVCHTYAKFYHNYFSYQMEMCAEFELNKHDNYLLLNWTQNLYPNDIKKNSVLVKELDEASIGNLLPLGQIKQLEQTYLTHETDFVRCCLDKGLKIEVTNWTKEVAPEILNDYYHSELSIDAIKAIFETQEAAKDITPELGHQMSALLLTELLTFLQCYKRDLETFIRRNQQHRYFEPIIIANMNNFENFRAHTEKSTGSTKSDVKTNIFSMLDDLQTTGVNGLLQPLFSEIQTLLKKFNDKKWDSCGGVMDEIITALDARILVFKRLKNPHRQVIMERIHLYLVQKYIQKIIWKKIKIKSPEKQNQLSELIYYDASILYKFCIENGSNATWLKSAIPSLAEIIRLQDPDAIKLEVSALASNYPDIKRKHLIAILHIKHLSTSNISNIVSVLDIHGGVTQPSSLLFPGIKAPFPLL
ncbi:PREDICTED: tumor necrosis factor alpha-induced protein 2 isoform X1 [Thamnophis sirtalis]|uniref:Tumor necrosis factor alpha-induced protein 2 isoform X1 n=1 Tax=Thamnophis sirtalis TaxID=35019 RepID=A0A6I9XD74_9SAUR|nr:PREDICTED: tumor necrosis factor alpha-induced protein 2 isoform X1 [Thamnophis sirtalis]